MMDEKEILQWIEAEQARRRAADAEHVRRLSREVGGDVRAWCATRRHAVRAAAMVVLLALPAGWYMLLPQRTDDRQVLCNVRGEEMLVVNRVCSVVGNCAERQVINILNMK